MTRILSEQGVDEAIAYVATQRPKILASIRARSAALHERNRIELRPLLLTAGMYETKAEFTKAYDLYIEILAIETNWIRPRNDLGMDSIQWKAIIKPEKAQDKLKEAVDICLETIELSKKEKKGEYWAEAQYYLGRAIREQGIRTDDKASVELLSHESRLTQGLNCEDPQKPAEGLGRNTKQSWECAFRSGHSQGWQGRCRAVGPGGESIPRGVDCQDPHTLATTMGSDQEQYGSCAFRTGILHGG